MQLLLKSEKLLLLWRYGRAFAFSSFCTIVGIGDVNNSDALFALHCGISFYTPEQLFR